MMNSKKSASLGVPQGTGSATGNPRNKTALTRGHSLMDWIRLGIDKGPSLNGIDGKTMTVTFDELTKHNTVDDAWTSIRGKVYNITPYLDFHPGGVDELMRGAGKDGTKLFNEFHKWVNADNMLEKCFIGKLSGLPSKSGSKSSLNSSQLDSTDSVNSSLSLPNNSVPNFPSVTEFTVPPPKPVDNKRPRFEWFQNDIQVTIVIYTKSKNISLDDIQIIRMEQQLKICCQLEKYQYKIHLALSHEVTQQSEVNIGKTSGKVEVNLMKSKVGIRWESIGRYLENHDKYTKLEDIVPEYYKARIYSIDDVSHDTLLFGIETPDGSRIRIPLGHHVYVKSHLDGLEVTRPYTVVLPSLSKDDQDPAIENGQRFYLMIKIYQDGMLTPQLKCLKVGDEISVSLPEGNFTMEQLDRCKSLVMLAAGTGFTPMVRLMYQALAQQNEKQRTIKLLFFNKTEKDIFWRDQLENLSSSTSGFEVIIILSMPDTEWGGLTGRISEELIKDIIPSDNKDDTLVCACGPTPFTKEAMRLMEEDFGYKKENLHAFLA